jgi:transposase-like protein
LKVDHKHGVSPQLIMKKKAGTTDTISISNWKQDQIIEFLKEKLEA